MKQIIILLNIISLLSIFFAFANGVNIVGGADGATNIHIPIATGITIKTPFIVVFTLILDLYWISKRC